MDIVRRRSRTELATLVAVFTLVIAGVIIWTMVLGNPDSDDDSDGLVAEGGASLTALGAIPDATFTPAQIAVVEPTSTPFSGPIGGTCQVSGLATELAVGVPFNAQLYPDWYTAEESNLWAAPLHYVTFVPSDPQFPADHWFADGVTTISWYGTAAPIQLTGKQLDGDAEFGPVEPRQTANLLQWTDVVIPAPGCWTLTGTSGDDTLEITVEVLPIDQRPDVILIESYYDARPYDAPETCAISAWTGPGIRGVNVEATDHRFPDPTGQAARGAGSTSAHYWLESSGIAAEVPGLFIANRQQSMGIFGPDVSEGIDVLGRKADSSLPEMFEATTTIWNNNARLANFSFPSSGCWDFTIATPTTTATFTVFVYPLECEPIWRGGQYVSDCSAP